MILVHTFLRERQGERREKEREIKEGEANNRTVFLNPGVLSVFPGVAKTSKYQTWSVPNFDVFSVYVVSYWFRVTE